MSQNVYWSARFSHVLDGFALRLAEETVIVAGIE
jgi:hypothetical protein